MQWNRNDSIRTAPSAWELEESELDRRVEEINRELEAIESGCHEPCPIHCVRPCCTSKVDP